MSEKIPECLQCGKQLKAGRADKKFCNEGCRNAYHNAQKIEENTEIKKINHSLKGNRKILKKILGNNKSATVSYETLLKSGFEFKYHTHYVTSIHQKNEYTFCYNYGYRALGNNKYMVVKSFD